MNEELRDAVSGFLFGLILHDRDWFYSPPFGRGLWGGVYNNIAPFPPSVFAIRHSTRERVLGLVVLYNPPQPLSQREGLEVS